MPNYLRKLQRHLTFAGLRRFLENKIPVRAGLAKDYRLIARTLAKPAPTKGFFFLEIALRRYLRNQVSDQMNVVKSFLGRNPVSA
jgi:hypothetical protein